MTQIYEILEYIMKLKEKINNCHYIPHEMSPNVNF